MAQQRTELLYKGNLMNQPKQHKNFFHICVLFELYLPFPRTKLAYLISLNIDFHQNGYKIYFNKLLFRDNSSLFCHDKTLPLYLKVSY